MDCGEVNAMNSTTYRLLALLPSHGEEGVMVLGNVQEQETIVGKVPETLQAAIHVHLLVVDVEVVKRGEAQRLVRGQRALHCSRSVSNRRLGVQVDDLDIG